MELSQLGWTLIVFSFGVVFAAVGFVGLYRKRKIDSRKRQ